MQKWKFKRSLISQFVIGIVILILITTVGISTIAYREFSNVLRKQYRRNAGGIADAVVQIMDGMDLQYYLETGIKDEAYASGLSILQSMVNTEDCEIIYIARVDEKKNERLYVFNVVNEKSELSAYELGESNAMSDSFRESYQAILETGERQTYRSSSDSMPGSYFTTVSPILDDSGRVTAVCGVVVALEELTKANDEYLRQIILFALILSAITGGGWVYIVRRWVVLPLRSIANETARFSENHEALDGEILGNDYHFNNEIGELSHAVEDMEHTIATNVRELVNVTAEKNRISTELNVARRIQEGALPKITEHFPGRKEFDLYAVMEPAKEVGGDFYDFFFVDEDHLALVIADVSDKGVPAALFMMISKMLLMVETTPEMDPAGVLASVNRRICAGNEADMFVSVWLGILKLSTGELTAANAGHEYPIITDENHNFRLMRDRHGLVVGCLEDSVYENYTLKMSPGDKLFVYTDGLAEAFNENKEQFGTGRILEKLNAHKQESPKTLVTSVMEAMSDFTSDCAQFDDTTILCLEYKGSVHIL